MDGELRLGDLPIVSGRENARERTMLALLSDKPETIEFTGWERDTDREHTDRLDDLTEDTIRRVRAELKESGLGIFQYPGEIEQMAIIQPRLDPLFHFVDKVMTECREFGVFVCAASPELKIRNPAMIDQFRISIRQQVSIPNTFYVYLKPFNRDLMVQTQKALVEVLFVKKSLPFDQIEQWLQEQSPVKGCRLSYEAFTESPLKQN